MRLRFGSLKNKNGILGIRLLVFYPINPVLQCADALKQFFNFRKCGLVRFLRFPGFRIVIIKQKIISPKDIN